MWGIELYKSVFGIDLLLSEYENGVSTIVGKGNGLQTVYQEFKEPYNNCILCYQRNESVRVGEATLYEDDIVRMKWCFEEGKRSGEFHVFRNGIVKYQSRWNAEEQWDFQPVIENIETGKILTLFDSQTLKVIFRGEYHAGSLCREGWGCEYDRITGSPLFCGYYQNDQLVYKEKVFTNPTNPTDACRYGDNNNDNDKRMIVYDHSHNDRCHPTNLKPVIYRGDYLDSFEERYPRHGQGILYDPITHQAIWKGEFEYDQPTYGMEINEDGWFCPLNPCSSSQTIQGSSFSPEQCIHIDLLPKTIACINIPDRTGNDLSYETLDFSSFTQLQSLRIGSHCFQLTASFHCENMAYLESIDIGEGCFNVLAEDLPTIQPSRVCCIVNNPSLQRISIGPLSFIDYYTFILTSMFAFIFFKKELLSVIVEWWLIGEY